MFSLVKFDNDEYCIVPSKRVELTDDINCLVKYRRGAKYKAYFVHKADTEDELKDIQQRIERETSNAGDNVTATSFGNEERQELLPNETSDGVQQDTNTMPCSTPLKLKTPPALATHLAKLGDFSTIIDTQEINVSLDAANICHDDEARGSEVPSYSVNILNAGNNTEDSSEVPSGASDILKRVGDSWTRDSEKSNDDRYDNEYVTPPRNTDEHEEHFSEIENTNEKSDIDHSSSGDDDANDTDYRPTESSHDTGTEVNASRSETEHLIPLETKTDVDARTLDVPVSKILAKRTVKKYFCPFCKTLQTKFARHLELKHKTEKDVQKFTSLKKGCRERLQIIETIRNYGNYIHNTNSELNSGILITSRQRQSKFPNTAENYIYCGNCKKLLSKRTIRFHYKNCSNNHKKGVREITVMGRRIAGYIHSCANDVFRQSVFPVMRDDAVTRSIKYDKLLILFGNKLCDKYTSSHQHDMIRAQLRLLGRFKLAIKEIRNDINDFADIFRPQCFDEVIQAIRVVAHWDTTIMWFRTPAVATMVTTLLKKCARNLRSESIKEQNESAKKDIEDFMLLFEEEIPVLINRKAIEDQIKQKRRKNVVLPLKQDIKLLYNYLKKNCTNSLAILKRQFDFSAWKLLTESTLVFIQMFNRRRAGEIERLTRTDYENQDSLETNVNVDLYKDLSEQSKQYARDFVRITIRGKLGRTVPVLLDSFMSECIKFILRYRKQAGVKSKNEYIFSATDVTAHKKPYIRACPLLRKFATECGATLPSSLRGTILRKHIATYTAILGLEETRIDTLANFMGHNKEIHKKFYRMPVPVKEITDVSRLLQAAMGGEEDENESDESDDNAEESINEGGRSCDPCTSQIVQNNSMNESSSCSENENTSNTSANYSGNSSGSKPRSTSPYGKTKRMKWTEEEKEAVLKHFGKLTELTRLPSLKECQNAINKYKVLNKRQPQQLKTWIDNQRRLTERRQLYLSRKK